MDQISTSVDACAILEQLTQKGLAEKTGIAQSAISRFESGNHNPSLAFLQRIAEGLGKKIYVEFR